MKSLESITTFEHRDEIIDVFIKDIEDDSVLGTIAVVTDCELADDIFQEAAKVPGTIIDCAKYEDCGAHIVTYNGVFGAISVQPIKDYEHMSSIEYAYVDMDGAVSKKTIDEISKYGDVFLFGEKDEFEQCEDEEECDKLYSISAYFNPDSEGSSSVSYYTSDKARYAAVKAVIETVLTAPEERHV